MPAKVHNLHNINALFKRTVHSLGVGPSTKQIEIGYASELKMLLFKPHKSYFSTCLHIFSIFLNFLEFPRGNKFPENYMEMIRISRNSGNFLQSGNTDWSLNPNSNVQVEAHPWDWLHRCTAPFCRIPSRSTSPSSTSGHSPACRTGHSADQGPSCFWPRRPEPGSPPTSSHSPYPCHRVLGWMVREKARQSFRRFVYRRSRTRRALTHWRLSRVY